MKIKIAKLFVFLLIPFILTACFEEPKKPVMPTWDIELNVPVGFKTFSIEEISNKQSQISTSPSRTLKFSTDTLKQDTTLDFLFNNTFDMEADTSFPVTPTTIEFDMIAGRDSVRMDSAEIKDGEVIYRIVNNNAFAVLVSFVFPGFTRINATSIDTFQITANVPANQSVQVSIPINNYKYKQPSNQPFGSTRPGIWIKGKLSSSVIGFGQSINVNFQIKDLKFNSFAGRVKPFNLGTKSRTIENVLSGDLKDFIKATTFNRAFMELTTSTTFRGFDVLLKGFQIIGKYNDGSPPIFLQFNGSNSKDIIIPAEQSVKVTFSTLNTSIAQFLKATPDSIQILATLIINPDYKFGYMNTSDKISFSSFLFAESQMKIENAVVTDTSKVDFNDDIKDKLSNGNGAFLNIEITNALPFEIQFVGYFVDKNYNKLFYYTRQTGSGSESDTVINISAAQVNNQGEVSVPTKSTINFSLSKDDFEKFKNVAFMVNRFKISTAQNQSVIIKADDYVRVKIFSRINFRVK